MSYKKPRNTLARGHKAMAALDRRNFLAGLLSVPAAAASGSAHAVTVKRNFNLNHTPAPAVAPVEPIPHQSTVPHRDPGPYELNSIYGALPNEEFPIPALAPGVLDKQFWRTVVDDPTGEIPGTVVVDTPGHYLYFVLPEGKAIRYGVGVGRAGFEWQGRARIAWKRKWPTWTPPDSMIAREPYLEKYRNGMQPGLDNPLGARALYIHENGVDTLYRVHGTNEPESIGKSVSSGCIRMINQDVIHLYDQVRPPTPILVRQGSAPLA